MEVFYILLIFVLFFMLNSFLFKSNKNSLKIKQSDIHFLLRNILVQTKTNINNKNTQLDKRSRNNKQNIIVLDNKAYWVSDNVFYQAYFENNNIIKESIEPVNISNMSKRELDKMLFILDNLSRGNTDDSGSSRNQ